MLERLKRANGTTANQVNWMTPFSGSAGVNLAELALRAHNEWLDNILAEAGSKLDIVLQLTADDNSLVGSCDVGYSCAYSSTISWLTPTIYRLLATFADSAATTRSPSSSETSSRTESTMERTRRTTRGISGTVMATITLKSPARNNDTTAIASRMPMISRNAHGVCHSCRSRRGASAARAA